MSMAAPNLVINKMKDREGLKNLILKRQGKGEKQSVDDIGFGFGSGRVFSRD